MRIRIHRVQFRNRELLRSQPGIGAKGFEVKTKPRGVPELQHDLYRTIVAHSSLRNRRDLPGADGVETEEISGAKILYRVCAVLTAAGRWWFVFEGRGGGLTVIGKIASLVEGAAR